MKKLIYSSLAVAIMLSSCQSETKKETSSTDSIVEVPMPPPPPISSDSVTPPPPPVDPNAPAPPPPPVESSGSADSKVYSFASMKNPPTYPGGMTAFYEFLGKNIKYPTAAVEKNVQGNVFCSFIVEKDGAITNVKVDRKLGSGTDEEAIRVLKMSKKWNPGMENGKLVRVQFNVPVKFTLAK